MESGSTQSQKCLRISGESFRKPQESSKLGRTSMGTLAMLDPTRTISHLCSTILCTSQSRMCLWEDNPWEKFLKDTAKSKAASKTLMPLECLWTTTTMLDSWTSTIMLPILRLLSLSPWHQEESPFSTTEVSKTLLEAMTLSTEKSYGTTSMRTMRPSNLSRLLTNTDPRLRALATPSWRSGKMIRSLPTLEELTSLLLWPTSKAHSRELSQTQACQGQSATSSIRLIAQWSTTEISTSLLTMEKSRSMSPKGNSWLLKKLSSSLNECS